MTQAYRDAQGTKTLIDNKLDNSIKTPRVTAHGRHLRPFKEIDWLLFGYLNWRRECRKEFSPQAEMQRAMDFKHLIEVFCDDYDLAPNSIKVYKATAYDFLNEPHCLFLIGKSRMEHLSAEECCEALNDLWQEHLIPHNHFDLGMGSAVIEPYENIEKYPAIRDCLTGTSRPITES